MIYRLAEMAESRRDELAEHVALAEGVRTRSRLKRLSRRRSTAWSGTRVDRQDRPGPRRHQSRRRSVLQLLDSRAERRRGRDQRTGRRRSTGFVDAVLAPHLRGQHGGRHCQRTRPTPAVLLGEMTASVGLSRPGVLNIVTGFTDELAPVLAAHEDVDGIDLAGVAPDVPTSWRRWAPDRSSGYFAPTSHESDSLASTPACLCRDVHGVAHDWTVMTNPYKLADRAADELRDESGYDVYDIAVVLGSGWREGAVALGTPTSDVATSSLSGFVAPTVAGHSGQILSLDDRRSSHRAGRRARPPLRGQHGRPSGAPDPHRHRGRRDQGRPHQRRRRHRSRRGTPARW